MYFIPCLLHEPQFPHPTVRNGGARIQLLIVVDLLLEEPRALVQRRLLGAYLPLLRRKRLGQRPGSSRSKH
jgi:hypothetical protein